ncbi:MAG: elongation factor G [Phycisphaerales bacterium]|nr:elongation factor G [Phycisphaerales bacterium]
MEDLSRLRNIGIAAHIDAGKTTTTERILFYSGTIHKMGDVDDGTTVTDFDAEEQQRGITIYSAAVSLEWRDCRINLIDTPGHVDFTAEVERSLRVLDGAVVVFDAKEGVEAQSETVWRQAERYRVPRICFLNKMDKTGADFTHALATIRDRLPSNPIPIQIPLGAESTFRGSIDLLRMKALVYPPTGDGRQFQVAEIPPEEAERAAEARHFMEEQVAELDDALMARYIEGRPLEEAELRAALRRGTIALRCQPVLCGSSLRFMGVQPVLDAVCDFLPSPLDIPPVEGHDPDKPDRVLRRRCDPEEPLAALVFKVVAEPHGDVHFIRVYSGVLRAGSRVTNVTRKKKENLPRLFRVFARKREQIEAASCGDIVAAVGLREALTGDTLCGNSDPILLERIEFPETVISMAIEPKSSADKDKLAAALAMLARSDPTFRYRIDPDTAQTLISGMGELHLEVVCHRLERDLRVPVRVGKPRVAYRETIGRAAEGEGRFERVFGEKRQFAVVRLRVEPVSVAAGSHEVQVFDRISEGRVQSQFAAAIQNGVRGAAMTGVLGGYPLINLRVTLLDAEEHPTDSSEVAFEAAGSLAFNRACEAGDPALLEPIMKVEVVTPEEYFGAINGDLASRRAVITNTATRGRDHVIDAEAPLSTMFGYSTHVRSLSQGRAGYSMEPCRYERLPSHLVKDVLGAF